MPVVARDHTSARSSGSTSSKLDTLNEGTLAVSSGATVCGVTDAGILQFFGEGSVSGTTLSSSRLGEANPGYTLSGLSARGGASLDVVLRGYSVSASVGGGRVAFDLTGTDSNRSIANSSCEITKSSRNASDATISGGGTDLQL